MVDFPGIASVLSAAFNDTVTSSRITEVTDEQTGITSQGFEQVILSAEPCYISVSRKDATGDQGSIGILKENIVLVFLPITADVQKGDWFVLTKGIKNLPVTQVIEGRAGVPQLYPTHLQVALEDVGYA